MTTKHKGALGVARAALYFTERGYNVAYPAAECQAYDLIVEKSGICFRVEVKYHVGRDVHLRTTNGRNGICGLVSDLTCDILFCITDDGEFEVPAYLLNGRKTIRPGAIKHPVPFIGQSKLMAN